MMIGPYSNTRYDPVRQLGKNVASFSNPPWAVRPIRENSPTIAAVKADPSAHNLAVTAISVFLSEAGDTFLSTMREFRCLNKRPHPRRRQRQFARAGTERVECSGNGVRHRAADRDD